MNELRSIDFKNPSGIQLIRAEENTLVIHADGEDIQFITTQGAHPFEKLYTEFNLAEYEIAQLKGIYKKIVINGVEGKGIVLSFESNDSSHDILIPCQHSWHDYSHGFLELSVVKGEESIIDEMDITVYTKEECY
ncbi:MAG TPA: hypothetical protein PK544_17410 [Spirochaetota bacterium]|nr:hypothetical protein [Spirochaetota bacterium]HPJ38863.1 hypothetical protein [Spirochaetota bacterium]HPQ55085.1 hypothetical protein [Spirochaetota bacterium]